MGRGDKRSKKGKIWRASHGKTRPTSQKIRVNKMEEEK
jgi:ribosomal small subunit protein bTHX